MKQLLITIHIMICLLACCGCDQLGGKSFTPALPGYNEKIEVEVILKKPLREISGITYLGNNQLAAINDEDGKIFTIDAETGKFRSVPFGRKGDYEDIVKVGDYYYVLESNGRIHKVSAINYKEEQEYISNYGKHAEFESLCYDAQLGQLIMICKECNRDEENINAFRFDLTLGQFLPETYFTLLLSDIRKLAKDNAIVCKPSAAAFHPISGKLFIIASVGKVMLQCSSNGRLEKVYRMNPDQFQQPEGLNFAPNGDMYISNEGTQAKATLIRFPYKK